MLDFGLHLKKLRKSRGFTQEQLAKILHVSKATVIRWENNYKIPAFESLMQMAEIYNVPLNYIAGIDQKRAIVTDHLSKQQEALLRTMVLEFQSRGVKSENVGLTQRQQDIISIIMMEFNGKSYKNK